MEGTDSKAVMPLGTARHSLRRFMCKSVVHILFGATAPQWARASFTRFPDHTQRRTTVGKTPLDEESARRRDLYLTTHHTSNRHPQSQ